jgi:predicted transcriptional regulator
MMKTVTLEIRTLADTLADFAKAMETGETSEPRIAFDSPALLFKTLTQKRWELLAAMQGAGAMTLREAARRVGRDVKAVHGDVHALLDAGILYKTPKSHVIFPFDGVNVNFILKAA